MKNLKYDLLSAYEKEEKAFRSWSIIFQLRIYGGFIFSILFNYNDPNFRFNAFLLVLYVIMFSPMIVCMVLFYMRKKAFRLWYVAGAVLIVTVNLISGAVLIAQAVIETFVIVALFKWNYVNKNFFSKTKIKGSNLKAIEDNEI